ncbi:MAG: GNAT family N-acetyltransferase [Oscillospiraceae bacterium]|nr:GNAT family N-acetyltransferase [Oscillospiraceae bacterium]
MDYKNFTLRTMEPDEIEQAIAIEQICFPPNEACSPAHMRVRAAAAPDLFLVAIDQKTGRLAGYLNGLATDENVFRDEFFTDDALHNPVGQTVMLLGLAVLPAYQMQGIARALVKEYRRREREKGRKALLLTCLDAKVEMYKKLGFTDNGLANSTWGGEQWHEMACWI